jgi:hypothetical protein
LRPAFDFVLVSQGGSFSPRAGPPALPRLTVLFFGAAQDVPEAAKMVPPGQPSVRFEITRGAHQSSRASTAEEVHHQRNQSYY